MVLSHTRFVESRSAAASCGFWFLTVVEREKNTTTNGRKFRSMCVGRQIIMKVHHIYTFEIWRAKNQMIQRAFQFLTPGDRLKMPAIMIGFDDFSLTVKTAHTHNSFVSITVSVGKRRSFQRWRYHIPYLEYGMVGTIPYIFCFSLLLGKKKNLHTVTEN
jgi:hypothetical protein